MGLASWVTAAVAQAAPSRPGSFIWGRHDSSLPGKGRTAPNTHADSGGPTPQNRAAVPGAVSRPVPILMRSRLRGHSKAAGSPPRRGGASLVRLTVGAGRQALPPSSGALWWGSGGPWDGASAPSPLSLRQLRLISLRPPTHLRSVWSTTADRRCGHGRRPIKAAGYRGCGPEHPQRARGPLTAGCHREGWPQRLPLGHGSPAAPWLSVLRSE